ncbi:lytic polysaccharide monooxygenase [Ideonella sp. DXS29W]|uniref:Lytic polysaccharide monooxygenase n=1 Tax=Ideonella lacteola TaxID=2984193 RepID=A0ABU9BH98_9BURK
MKLARIAWLGLAAVALPLSAVAHGYISAPESRGYQCKLGNNTDCGAIQWEPQSLEAPSGWPAGGPPDQHIASANHDSFAELDVQTKARWTKGKMKGGQNSFTWTFTANHVTRNWRYYITKQGWNPSQKLTRASFETAPFCTVDGGMRQPPMQVTHNCNVPSRTGYQIILGVWEIGDTSNSFYNVIDVKFPKASGKYEED